MLLTLINLFLLLPTTLIYIGDNGAQERGGE